MPVAKTRIHAAVKRREFILLMVFPDIGLVELLFILLCVLEIPLAVGQDTAITDKYKMQS